MANIKISQLPAASTITAGSDVLPIVHNSVTEKATPNQVVNKVLEAPGAIGGTTPSTGAFTEVTTEDFTTTGDVSLNGYITANATAAFFNQPRIYDYANTYTYRVRGVSPGLGADVFCFLPVLGGNDYFVFQGHAQTLTNKTISGSSNTLTNIGNASLSNSSITINGTSVSLGGSISVGSGIPYPGSGIPVSTGTSWSTSLTVPSGALVGTLATQELTNKTLTFPQINGGNIAGLSDLEATGNISLPFLTANSTALWLRSPRIYDYVGTTYSYRISGVSPGLSTDVYCFLPALSGNDTFVFRDFAQTLTNKTISGSSNTLSNIANASLTNSTITINGTAVALGGSITVGGGISYPGAGVAVSTGSAWGTSKAAPSGVIVGDTDTQTLTSKTLTSPTINGGSATSLTTLSVGTGGSVTFPFLNIDTTALWLRNPRIYDPSENNWYRITPSELTDNRYITLPALTGNDTFVFESHTQTLTNKTLTSPVINGFTTVSDTNTPSSSNIPLLLKGGSAGVAGDGGGIAFSTAVLSAITDASQAATSIRSLNEFASETNGEQGSLAFYTNRRTGTNTYSGLVERLKIGSAGGIAFSGSYGSAGQVLTSSGSSAAPTWSSVGAASGWTQSTETAPLPGGGTDTIDSTFTIKRAINGYVGNWGAGTAPQFETEPSFTGNARYTSSVDFGSTGMYSFGFDASSTFMGGFKARCGIAAVSALSGLGTSSVTITIPTVASLPASTTWNSQAVYYSGSIYIWNDLPGPGDVKGWHAITSSTAVGSRAYIYNTGGTTGLNGLWFTISSITGANIVISVSGTGGTFTSGGSITFLLPTRPYDGINEWDVQVWNNNKWVGLGYFNWQTEGAATTYDVPTGFVIGASLGDATSDAVRGAPRIYAQGNGYLGVGTWSAFSFFDVTPDAGTISDPWFTFPSTSFVIASFRYPYATNGAGAAIRANDGYQANTPVYAFWYDDMTGIGNPDASVTNVVCASAEISRWTPSGYQVNNLAGTGNRAVYSTSTGLLTNTSSDGTLKTNVTTLSDSLNKVKALRGVSFNWKNTDVLGNQKEIGLIAQEVQQIVPEVIGVNDDGTLSLDYPKLTALLIESIKELTARLEALEAP